MKSIPTRMRRAILVLLFAASAVLLMAGTVFYLSPIHRGEDLTHKESHPFTCELQAGELHVQPGVAHPRANYSDDWWLDIDVRVQSGKIDLAFVDQSEFEKWSNGTSPSFIFLAENVSSYGYTFRRPSTGTYYVLLNNSRYADAKTVDLNVYFYALLPNYDLSSSILGSHLIICGAILLCPSGMMLDWSFALSSNHLTLARALPFIDWKVTRTGRLVSRLLTIAFWGGLLAVVGLNLFDIGSKIVELQSQSYWTEMRPFVEDSYLRILISQLIRTVLLFLLFLVIGLAFVGVSNRVSRALFKYSSEQKRVLWSDFLNRLFHELRSRLVVVFMGFALLACILISGSFQSSWVPFLMVSSLSGLVAAYSAFVSYRSACQKSGLDVNEELRSDAAFILGQTMLCFLLLIVLLLLLRLFPLMINAFETVFWKGTPAVEKYPDFLVFINSENAMLSSIMSSAFAYSTIFMFSWFAAFGIGAIYLIPRIVRFNWNEMKSLAISAIIFIVIFTGVRYLSMLVQSTLDPSDQAFWYFFALLGAVVGWLARKTLSLYKESRASKTAAE